jgi:hypothetical protein
MYVSFDTRSREIISLRVSDEGVRDHRMFKDIVGDVLERCHIERVLADRGYDTRDSFNYLDERRIDRGIRVRRNASRKSRGSPSRRKSVIKQEDYDEWRKNKGYGYRWLVESAFSSIKRTYSIEEDGENSRRSSMENTTIQRGSFKIFRVFIVQLWVCSVGMAVPLSWFLKLLVGG